MHGVAELLEIQRSRLPFRLNLRRFDGEGGEGGDGGGSGAGDGGSAGGGEGQGGEGGSGAGDGGKPAGGEPKTFTQEQIDKIVKDRLERQRQQFAGFDDLKKKAEEWDKLQEEQKSELEKANERAVKAEETASTATQRANATLIRAEIISKAATAAGERKAFVDPADAFAHLRDNGDIKVDDDGNVVGVDEALEALAKSKPHLLADSRPGGSADGGARGGEGNGKKDFRTASSEDYAAELAKHGLRPRST
jgi:hypothetical protein